MKSFKEYLTEANSNIKGKELLDKIGMTRMRSMSKHPFYQSYVRDYAALREPVYTHAKTNLGHKVQAASENTTMVSFDFHNYKVTNAHLYKWDGQSRHDNGQKKWEWKKSYREDE